MFTWSTLHIGIAPIHCAFHILILNEVKSKKKSGMIVIGSTFKSSVDPMPIEVSRTTLSQPTLVAAD